MRYIAAIAPILSLVIGAGVLGSWLDDAYQVIYGCVGCISMKPTTAVCVIVLSAAVLMLRLRYYRVVSALCGIEMALLLTVLFYAFTGIDLRIETWFLEASTDFLGPSLVPGVPSIGTLAVLFTGLIGIAPHAMAGRRITMIPGVIVALIGAVATLGYVVGTPALYWWMGGSSNAISLPASIAFVLLGLGMAGAESEDA